MCVLHEHSAFIYEQNLKLVNDIKKLNEKYNNLLIDYENVKKSNQYLIHDNNILLDNINKKQLDDNILHSIEENNNLCQCCQNYNNTSFVLDSKSKDNIIYKLENQVKTLQRRVSNQQLMINYFRQNLPSGFKEKKPSELLNELKSGKRKLKK